jgi:hypothetical protein
MLNKGRPGKPEEPTESGIAPFDGGEGPRDSQPKPSAAARKAILGIWADKGTRIRYPIAGNSMLPIVRDGDTALVEHGIRGARVGTIILFRSGKSLTAHRVLRCVRRSGNAIYYVKGDNAWQTDRVSQSAVIGHVLGIERDGCHLRLDTFLWRGVGWLMAVLVPWRHLGCQHGGPGGRQQGSTVRVWMVGLLGRLRLRLAAVMPRIALVVAGRWRAGTLP